MCNSEQEDLVRIETGLKLRLQELQVEKQIPPEVCTSCFKDLSSRVSQGAKLRAEVNAQEHNKRVLWKNRISIVKSARERMSVKAYAEASVLYEKYIRTLEITQGKEPGQLDPKEFAVPGKDKELTVIASVYWDLMRIYDSQPSYGPKISKIGNKLLEVIPLTAAGRDILNRIEKFSKTANNAKTFKDFLKEARKTTSSSCFIATSVYYFDDANEVVILRQFRDDLLVRNFFGRSFVRIYYATSPHIANFLDQKPHLKAYIRKPLTSFALRLAKRFNLKTSSES